VKNTVRYYLIVAFLLVFLFFSNDFGLTDVQKTAIVMAVGVDREEDTFIVTSQIAIPQSSKQGQSSEAVQLVSRGKTIGEAFEEINAKTGWYPKLVFCNLIVLGEKAASENVFDALDYFLRDEYLSDNCFVAACDGLAKDILDTSALVDPSSSTAIQKVLSDHAERVGTVMPNTLKDFSIGYFSDSKSSFLPVVKKEPQQEHIDGSTSEGKDNSTGQSGSQGGAQGSSQSSGGESGQKQQDKPVFSASETALFVRGKRVETLKTEETFALSAVLNKLRLAAYSVEREGKTCTLTIKHNAPKIKLETGEEDAFRLSIDLTMSAGILDFSKSQDLKSISDVGDVPKEFFTMAEQKLSAQIQTVYEKCRAAECDVFGVRERLIKYERRRFHKHEDTAFENTRAEVKVKFRNIR
jgi:Ger(x)C family germination protein